MNGKNGDRRSVQQILQLLQGRKTLTASELLGLEAGFAESQVDVAYRERILEIERLKPAIAPNMCQQLIRIMGQAKLKLSTATAPPIAELPTDPFAVPPPLINDLTDPLSLPPAAVSSPPERKSTEAQPRTAIAIVAAISAAVIFLGILIFVIGANSSKGRPIADRKGTSPSRAGTGAELPLPPQPPKTIFPAETVNDIPAVPPSPPPISLDVETTSSQESAEDPIKPLAAPNVAQEKFLVVTRPAITVDVLRSDVSSEPSGIRLVKFPAKPSGDVEVVLDSSAAVTEPGKEFKISTVGDNSWHVVLGATSVGLLENSDSKLVAKIELNGTELQMSWGDKPSEPTDQLANCVLNVTTNQDEIRVVLRKALELKPQAVGLSKPTTSFPVALVALPHRDRIRFRIQDVKRSSSNVEKIRTDELPLGKSVKFNIAAAPKCDLSLELGSNKNGLAITQRAYCYPSDGQRTELSIESLQSAVLIAERRLDQQANKLNAMRLRLRQIPSDINRVESASVPPAVVNATRASLLQEAQATSSAVERLSKSLPELNASVTRLRACLNMAKAMDGNIQIRFAIVAQADSGDILLAQVK